MLQNIFIRFKGPLLIYNDINNGQISLQKEEKIPEEFRSPNCKSNIQKLQQKI